MRSLLASAFCLSLISPSLARIAGHAAQAKAVAAVSPAGHGGTKPIGPSFSCPQNNGSTISQLIDTERFDYLVLCDFDFPDDNTFYKGLSYDTFQECTAACSAADALFDESFCAVAIYYDTPDDKGHNCLLKPSTSTGEYRSGVHAAILQTVALGVDNKTPKDESNKFVGINQLSEDEALSSSVSELLGDGSSTSIALVTPPPLLVQKRQAPFTAFTTVINDGSTYSTGTEFHTYFTSDGSWYSAYYSAWSVAWTAATTVYGIGAQATGITNSTKIDTSVIDQGPGGYVTVQNTTVITYTYTPTYVITNSTDTIIYSSFYRNGTFITASTTVIISAATSYISGGGSGGMITGGAGGINSGLVTGSSLFLTTITTGNTAAASTGAQTLLPSPAQTALFGATSIPSQSVPSSIIAGNGAQTTVNSYGTGGATSGIFSGLITGSSAAASPSQLTVIVSSFNTGGSAGGIDSGLIPQSTLTTASPLTVIVASGGTAGSTGGFGSGLITQSTVTTSLPLSAVTSIVNSFGTGGSTGGFGSGLITGSTLATPSPLTVIVASGGTAGSTGGFGSGLITQSTTSIPSPLTVIVSSGGTAGSTGGSTGGMFSGPVTAPTSLPSLLSTSMDTPFQPSSGARRYTVISGVTYEITQSTALVQSTSGGTAGSTGTIISGVLTQPYVPNVSTLPIAVPSTSSGGASMSTTSPVVSPLTASASSSSDVGPFSPPSGNRLPYTVISGSTYYYTTTYTATTFSTGTGGSTGFITSGIVPPPFTFPPYGGSSSPSAISSGSPSPSSSSSSSEAPFSPPSGNRLPYTVISGSTYYYTTTYTSIGASTGTAGSTGFITSGVVPPPFTQPPYGYTPSSTPTSSASSSEVPFSPPSGDRVPYTVISGSTYYYTTTYTPTSSSGGTAGSTGLVTSGIIPPFSFPSYGATPSPTPSQSVSSSTLSSSGAPFSPPSGDRVPYTVISGSTYYYSTTTTATAASSSSGAAGSTGTIMSGLLSSSGTLPVSPLTFSASSGSLPPLIQTASTDTLSIPSGLRTPGPFTSSSSSSSIPVVPTIPVYPYPGYVPKQDTSSTPESTPSYTGPLRTGSQPYPPESTVSSGTAVSPLTNSGTGSLPYSSPTYTGPLRTGSQPFPSSATDSMTASSPPVGTSMSGTASPSLPPFITSVNNTTCTLATTTVFTTVTLYGCYSQCTGGYIPPQAFGAGPGFR